MRHVPFRPGAMVAALILCSTLLAGWLLRFPLAASATARPAHAHRTSNIAQSFSDESSYATPSLIGFDDGTGNSLYVAWAGTGSPAFLNIIQANGGNIYTKTTLTDWTQYAQPNAGPSVAYFQPGGATHPRLYVAWQGDENESQHTGLVHVGWFNHTTVLQDRNVITINGATQATGAGPAITQFNGKLYCAWKGATNNNIFIASSSDGLHWSNLVGINDYTYTSPTLTGFNGLHVTFAGTNNTLYTGVFVGTPNLQNHTSIPQSSQWEPGTANFGGKLWLAWADANDFEYADYASASDGFHFGSVASCPDALAYHSAVSNAGVALGPYNGHLYCAFPQAIDINNLTPSLNVVQIA